MSENLAVSYKYLLVANMGYQLAINDGKYYFEASLEEVKNRMDDPMYDDVRNTVKKQFKEEYDVH